MPDRVRRAGVPAVILLLLGIIVAVLVLGTGRPTDRAYELEQRLRCPVCKTVSIAESQSDTAVAMRATVADQIATGRSDEQIVAYFTERYGNWVLMDPPTTGDTLLLWLIPLGVAAAGVLLLVRRRPRRALAGLTDEDRARVAAALEPWRDRADADGEL